MKTTAVFGSIALGLLPSTTSGLALGDQIPRAMSVKPRALPNAPNGYAPVNVTCPTTRPSIRSAATLSSEETTWLDSRRNKTIPALKDFFSHVDIDKFDASSYIDKFSSDVADLPNIAIAISGGGMRAFLNGAGALKAFDDRTEGATATGQLGGLLQSATYVAALSGGSWLLSSVFVNNFTTIGALQEDVWDFTSPFIYYGPETMDPTQFWGNMTAQVTAKKDAGFVTSSADFWGRMQGYYFLNASHGGVDYTWSSIAETMAFQDGDIPLPLVVADGQYFNNSEADPTFDLPIYEISPWEFGTYDDSMYGFAPLKYLGSRFVSGALPENETCVLGFDNAGFITGTSSDIYNEGGVDISVMLTTQVIPQIPTNTTEGVELVALLTEAVTEYFSAVSSTNATVDGPAAYDPNPFYQYNTATSKFAQDTRLTVVDGGENGQNIPLYPLIQKKRNVDVIFAIDSDNDDREYKWPNGTSLVHTYERTLAGFANDTSFPSIPDVNTFLNLGLNSQPTFFGCNSSNLTTPAPLIVYLPNHPITAMSNVSVFDTSFSNEERDSYIINGYNVVTQGNGTLDSEWSTCVGCAILSRSFDRTNTTVPQACTKCFEQYCWNGTIDAQTPPASVYAPTEVLPANSTTATSTSTSAKKTGAANSLSSSLVSVWGPAGVMAGMILFAIV